MAIDLKDYEKGEPLQSSVDYGKALKKLQNRLTRIQAAHIRQGARTIILVEGWDAGGKSGVIERLTAELDPRHLAVWPITAPTGEEKRHHFLWRFWQRLPGDGDIHVFDRSWYGRVLVERVEGFCAPADWERGYDEINAFEYQQIEAGTTLIKLFLHVTQAVQDEQLAERLEDPWKRWKTNADDYRNRARRADYLAAMAEMFARTDTAWAPWAVIDGNDRRAARIRTLTHVVEHMEARLDMSPPDADPDLVALAEKALGRKLAV